MSETKENLVFRSLVFDESARTLLENQGLPVSDLPDDRVVFYELLHEDERAAIGALQFLGDSGLLRSVAVDPAVQERGYGSKLVHRLIEVARDAPIRELYLLTTTAEAFFDKFGFRVVNREEAPQALQSTEEFRSLCSQSAVLMVKHLEGDADIDGVR